VLRQRLISGVPPGGHLAAGTAYDSDGLRRFLLERGTVPVILNNPTRKRHHPFDETAYRQRNLIERMSCRLKDWRRIATRYDKLAANFAAAIMIPAVISRGPDRVRSPRVNNFQPRLIGMDFNLASVIGVRQKTAQTLNDYPT
jgi:putative transposase